MRGIKLFAIVLFLMGLVSCEKVIDIDLKTADPKFVVEGIVTNEPGVCRVLISKTIPFTSVNQFSGVSGAIVKVTDNGVEYNLAETQPGNYQTTLLNGTPGHVYNLSVLVSGQVFTATSTMPYPVRLDTLYVAPGPYGLFNFAYIFYTDPAGINNGYRFVQYLNDRKDPVIFWDDDEFTDGQRVGWWLDNGQDERDDPRVIHSGDRVKVEMQTIDDSVLKFWTSLQSGGGDGSGYNAAPANPVTNMQGGALGYFSAHTVDRRTVIAP